MPRLSEEAIQEIGTLFGPEIDSPPREGMDKIFRTSLWWIILPVGGLILVTASSIFKRQPFNYPIALMLLVPAVAGYFLWRFGRFSRMYTLFRKRHRLSKFTLDLSLVTADSQEKMILPSRLNLHRMVKATVQDEGINLESRGIPFFTQPFGYIQSEEFKNLQARERFLMILRNHKITVEIAEQDHPPRPHELNAS